MYKLAIECMIRNVQFEIADVMTPVDLKELSMASEAEQSRGSLETRLYTLSTRANEMFKFIKFNKLHCEKKIRLYFILIIITWIAIPRQFTILCNVLC